MKSFYDFLLIVHLKILILLHYLECRPPPLFTYRPQKRSVIDPINIYEQKGVQVNFIWGLQLKWIPKSDMKYELKTARFALTYRPLIFLEINRGSVSEQGWGLHSRQCSNSMSDIQSYSQF
ncbi:Hypothetical_protein [Hexamita inflata]|uniref:Hypothetical_protein n=1 Tax=Hexamita inflata TaxID=28002 RepID=A0AA86NKL1_9EUKA|nr:Hypothetical protein HINF_LOCUS9190 [Hexamita inflata]